MKDNRTQLLGIEFLAEMYGIKQCDVNCDHCRFKNKGTENYDTHTCYCAYWKQKVMQKSFCTHFSKDISELLDKAVK